MSFYTYENYDLPVTIMDGKFNIVFYTGFNLPRNHFIYSHQRNHKTSIEAIISKYITPVFPRGTVFPLHMMFPSSRMYPDPSPRSPTPINKASIDVWNKWDRILDTIYDIQEWVTESDRGASPKKLGEYPWNRISCVIPNEHYRGIYPAGQVAWILTSKTTLLFVHANKGTIAIQGDYSTETSNPVINEILKHMEANIGDFYQDPNNSLNKFTWSVPHLPPAYTATGPITGVVDYSYGFIPRRDMVQKVGTLSVNEAGRDISDRCTYTIPTLYKDMIYVKENILYAFPIMTPNVKSIDAVVVATDDHNRTVDIDINLNLETYRPRLEFTDRHVSMLPRIVPDIKLFDMTVWENGFDNTSDYNFELTDLCKDLMVLDNLEDYISIVDNKVYIKSLVNYIDSVIFVEIVATHKTIPDKKCWYALPFHTEILSMLSVSINGLPALLPRLDTDFKLGNCTVIDSITNNDITSTCSFELTGPDKDLLYIKPGTTELYLKPLILSPKKILDFNLIATDSFGKTSGISLYMSVKEYDLEVHLTGNSDINMSYDDVDFMMVSVMYNNIDITQHLNLDYYVNGLFTDYVTLNNGLFTFSPPPTDIREQLYVKVTAGFLGKLVSNEKYHDINYISSPVLTISNLPTILEKGAPNPPPVPVIEVIDNHTDISADAFLELNSNDPEHYYYKKKPNLPVVFKLTPKENEDTSLTFEVQAVSRYGIESNKEIITLPMQWYGDYRKPISLDIYLEEYIRQTGYMNTWKSVGSEMVGGAIVIKDDLGVDRNQFFSYELTIEDEYKDHISLVNNIVMVKGLYGSELHKIEFSVKATDKYGNTETLNVSRKLYKDIRAEVMPDNTEIPKVTINTLIGPVNVFDNVNGKDLTEHCTVNVTSNDIPSLFFIRDGSFDPANPPEFPSLYIKYNKNRDEIDYHLTYTIVYNANQTLRVSKVYKTDGYSRIPGIMFESMSAIPFLRSPSIQHVGKVIPYNRFDPLVPIQLESRKEVIEEHGDLVAEVGLIVTRVENAELPTMEEQEDYNNSLPDIVRGVKVIVGGITKDKVTSMWEAGAIDNPDVLRMDGMALVMNLTAKTITATISYKVIGETTETIETITRPNNYSKWITENKMVMLNTQLHEVLIDTTTLYEVKVIATIEEPEELTETWSEQANSDDDMFSIQGDKLTITLPSNSTRADIHYALLGENVTTTETVYKNTVDDKWFTSNNLVKPTPNKHSVTIDTSAIFTRSLEIIDPVIPHVCELGRIFYIGTAFTMPGFYLVAQHLQYLERPALISNPLTQHVRIYIKAIERNGRIATHVHTMRIEW